METRLTGADGAKHLNEMRQLFALCEAPDLNVVAEALQAIRRVLTHHRASPAGKKAEIAQFLDRHQDAYHSTLQQLCSLGSARAQVLSLRLMLASAQQDSLEMPAPSRQEASSLQQALDRFVASLLTARTMHDATLDCLIREYAEPYVDVRYNLLCSLRSFLVKVAAMEFVEKDGAAAPERDAKKRKLDSAFEKALQESTLSGEDAFVRSLLLLQRVPEPAAGVAAAAGGDADDPGMSAPVFVALSGKPSSFFVKFARKSFQDAWLQLLGLRVPTARYKPLLQLLPSHVMPHMTQPLLLADFYLKAFGSGSAEVAVLSLSGLFLLLTKHAMGDPETLSSSCGEFYGQLYSLLKPETFRLAKRARFQRLAAASLASGLLPARFAAAFAKRCMRTALSCSDPGTVMWLMAVAYSLIQRHHSLCKYLLHKPKEEQQPRGGEQAEAAVFEDTDDLKLAVKQVAETSLWEVLLLTRHHVPAVALLARLFLKPFFKPSAKKLDPDVFLDQRAEKLCAQAHKASKRQVSKLKARGERVPVAFTVEDDVAANKVAGWAAALSTSQRRIGAGI